MRLPCNPWSEATWPAYFLAAHARWAAWAKQMRLEGNIEAARLYARLARERLADWQAASEARVR